MAKYIDREAAYRAIEIACNGCPCEKTVAGSVCHDCSIMKAKSEFQALPAADVRPVVRGKWIDGFCSACHTEAITEWNDVGGEYALSNFCPNCGADMREES